MLDLFLFRKATAADIVQRIMAYQKKKKLLFERPFNISCDGPNISKLMWSRLNGTLKEMRHQGGIPFCTCSLQTLHNAFKKCIEAREGGRASELAYDLHNWFKDKPCKNLCECVIMSNESLFLRLFFSVSTWWLFLSSVLVRILKRWNDAKTYFLEYLPKQKKCQRVLDSDEKY